MNLGYCTHYNYDFEFIKFDNSKKKHGNKAKNGEIFIFIDHQKSFFDIAREFSLLREFSKNCGLSGMLIKAGKNGLGKLGHCS